MFTGIIQHVGTLRKIEQEKGHGFLSISAPSFQDSPGLGDSISVMGVCLTVTSCSGGELTFDVLEESFQRSNLGVKQPGDLLNLEPALKYGHPMGGHLVQGHVDESCRVKSIERQERDRVVTIECSPELLQRMIYKGSVAVDGISLTIAELLDDGIRFHVIPHTWNETSFKTVNQGDRVNVEADLIASYVRRMCDTGVFDNRISWQHIRAHGFPVSDSP